MIVVVPDLATVVAASVQGEGGTTHLAARPIARSQRALVDHGVHLRLRVRVRLFSLSFFFLKRYVPLLVLFFLSCTCTCVGLHDDRIYARDIPPTDLAAC